MNSPSVQPPLNTTGWSHLDKQIMSERNDISSDLRCKKSSNLINQTLSLSEGFELNTWKNKTMN